MKCRTTPICLILALVLMLGLCDVTVARADTSLTAVEDPDSTYAPTKIVNGDFSTRPFMAFKFNDTWYTKYVNDKTPAFGSVIEEASPNGVNGGWNTTETKVYEGTLFEYSNAAWRNYKNIGNNGYFIEMSANTPSTLYQDVSTTGGDIIRWTLRHGFRGGGNSRQTMKAFVGAPKAEGSVTHTDPNMTEESKGLYESTGVTNPSGATLAYAGELSNLDLSANSSAKWYDCSGIYIVPEGQTVTRFAFEADYPTNGWGNLLDDITFSTLIGNLSITDDGDGNAVVKGYWGDTDPDKKLVIMIGDQEYQVDMSQVSPGNFSITIPASEIGSADKITVYHEDYSDASVTMDLHQHSLVYEAEDATLSVYCDNPTMADHCDIQGEENKVSITVSAQSKVYDGTPVIATLSDTTEWEGVVEEVPTIEYYNEDGEKLDEAPSAVGNYTARISAGGKTAMTAFSITKRKPDPPEVIGVPPTAPGAKDGRIENVDDTMEYSTDGGETWIPVPEGADTITDLGEGDYLVRYQETDTDEASEAVTVTLKAKRSASDVPKTGDPTHIVLYASALMLSAACVVILLKRKRSM